MSKFDNLYAKIPVWAQHGAVSLYGMYWHWLRFGPGYSRFVREYQAHEKFTRQQWQEWQSNKLQHLLINCMNHVPFYKKNWTDSQKQAARNGQISALPLLEKDSIRTCPEDFIREDLHPLFPQKFLTSGSTGTPISSYFTIPEYRQALAVREARSARWAGVSFTQPRATFSGRIVEPDPLSVGPFYRFNAVEQQVYFSAFHLSQKTAAQYVDALHKHHIQWLTGYAVSYYLLAKFMLQEGLKPPPLKAVITTSEKVTAKMRQVMEDAYQCRVYEEYSTVENALFASECEHGSLHLSPDVGLVEILNSNGEACKPGEVGEVVATCLMRSYQPFIRYRLGDLAMWADEPCPCGKNMPVIKEVVGRIEDVVIGTDGRQTVRFHGIFTGQPNIVEGQIIQESLNTIRVKVVPEPAFGKNDIQDITQRIQQRLGPQVNVLVESTDRIPRTSAGKFQAVVSLLRNRGDKTAERTGLEVK